MGKRSGQFDRIPKDKYATPREAVLPLLPQLPARTLFAEPCAGNGALIDLLASEGHQCVLASDVAPERPWIQVLDALELRNIDADMVITNPPWTRNILHPIIDHLSAILPCWFLFDADWAYTRQSADLIRRCAKIVPIGRIKWIPDSPHVGKDNACWYQFLPGHSIGPRFVGRETIRKGHVETQTTSLPLVQATDGPRSSEIKSDARSCDSLLAGRNANGASLPAMQQSERRDDAGSVGIVPASSSSLLETLRSKMRPMVLPRIDPGALGE